MERSVSYGKGTARGPAAILEASLQLEAFDGESVPCASGIHTRPPVETLEAIEAAVVDVLKGGKVPVVLGGEHTVSLGAFRAFASFGEPFGIVQFDAHADLRDVYEGDPLSHACTMRRALDLEIPLLQIGVRALSREEFDLRRERRIPHVDGYAIGQRGLPDRLLPADFPERVYVTFDVDALDPSIMPATGTPEPGGLDWFRTMRALEKISRRRRIVGFDVVELAPIVGLHAPDFLAARLVYDLMGLIDRSPA